ncbi:MAG: glycosyltransferase [Ignavibacteriales bacterium]|nr:MAG: glycosyltransferase [Ignavibacteriales bacterium]
MKKVLFITFYWPPSGKASLHWPMKIIKHLPKFGWQPIVLTVKEDTFSAKDESLLSEVDPNLEVIKTDYFDPFIYYRKFLGKSKYEPLIASETISTSNKSLKHKITVWIRMNLFVPDARVGWNRIAIKETKKYLKKNPVDAIVSVGPPHSSHLIGKKLGRLFNLPHFPVLIDPWIDISYYRDFKRNPLTLSLDKYFEKSIMKSASKVIFVTESMKNDFIVRYNWLRNKSDVLYWGYNEEDFEGLQPKLKNDYEILLHAGNIFDYQNPINFWSTIKKEIDKGRKLRIKFIGTVSPGIKNSIEQNGLTSYTEYSGFLPYKNVLVEMLSADYLLVCATEKRHVPGKLFEYLRTGKPIIAFGDDNEEVKNIIGEANAGYLYSYKNNADDFFEKAKQLISNTNVIKKYDRLTVAEKMSNILLK